MTCERPQVRVLHRPPNTGTPPRWFPIDTPVQPQLESTKMPRRKYLLATDVYYHVFNRSVDKQPIFTKNSELNRALGTIRYYNCAQPPLRFSKFLNLPSEQRAAILESVIKSRKLVDLVAYCFMPNHFHLLLKQTIDSGISKFIGNFQNSYARYFNTKSERISPLWQGQFKAVRIEDESQLLHISRYIHLNPHASFVVKNLEALLQYQWSSLLEYLNPSTEGVCSKEIILSQFGSLEDYRKFIFDQADYQRRLEGIKHLTLD